MVPQTLPALLHPGQLTTVVGNLPQCSRNKKEKNISEHYRMECPYAYWSGWHTDRPHRRSALITSELARYKIDIAALSKIRLAAKGELTVKSSSYSFFWGERAPDDKREAGVDYAVKTSFVSMLACPRKGWMTASWLWNFHFIMGKSSQPSSVPMHPLWLTRMRQKTSSMKTLNMLSPRFPLQTSSLFLATLIQELDKTERLGKEYWVNTGPKNATATAYCFFRPASSIIF